MSVMPYTNNIHYFMQFHHINYQPQPPKSDDIISPGILRSSISSVEISRVGGPSNDSDTVTYHCEPCDKSFKCVRSYETHLQSHETCKHAGFSFVTNFCFSNNSLNFGVIKYIILSLNSKCSKRCIIVVRPFVEISCELLKVTWGMTSE